MLGLCEIFKNKSRVAEQRWLKSLIWCHLEANNFDKKKWIRTDCSDFVWDISLAKICTGSDTEQIVLLLYISHIEMNG